MRTLASLRPGSRRPALLAATGLAALVFASGPARPADCVVAPGVSVLASAGVVCNVSGSFATGADGGIAGWATGLGAVIVAPVGEPAISFSTAADSTSAVKADSGGSVTLTPASGYPGTVSTTGVSSAGLFATGSVSTVSGTVASSITARNVDVSTGGTGSAGARADGGAALDLTGGSITANGNGGQGVLLSGKGTSLVATGVSITTNGTYSAFQANNFPIALDVAAGASATFSGGSIATTGNSAIAVSSVGPGASVTLSGGTKVSTTGLGAAGLSVGFGGTLSASGIGVTTKGGADASDGFFSTGAYNGGTNFYSGGGRLSLTDTTISTQGSGTTGVLTSSGGTTTISGGSITTTGPGAQALVATGGGSITIGASARGQATIGTSGAGAFVAVAQSGGRIVLNGQQIATTANGSGGLGVTGAGSEIDATNVTISTRGGYDTASGLTAWGAVNTAYGSSTSGGVLRLTGTTISTQGDHTAGVYTGAGGATTILGGSVNTSGANALGLLASGAGSSVSASNGATIATSGAQSQAVQADSGGRVSLSGGSVTASGAGSEGLFAMNAGSTITAKNVAVTTRGGYNPITNNGGVAVLSYDGGSISVSGGSITNASPYSSAAVGAQGKGSSISLSGGTIIQTSGLGDTGVVVLGSGASLAATDVSITTRGGVDPSTGDVASGAYNGSYPGLMAGGAMSLTNTTIVTTGSGASGVVTNSGGSTTVASSSVATSGQDAHAVYATGAGSQVNLSGANSFVTQGQGAIGLYAALGGVVTAAGGSTTTVTTAGGVSPATGLAASGVVADGAGSQVNLGAATITASGAGAYGLLASDAAGGGTAGSITASGRLAIVTTNAAATAIGLQGNGASIVATGGGTITAAGNVFAFLGGTGQTATFDNFTVNAKSGDFVYADPSAATVNLNNSTVNAANLVNATGGSFVTLNASASTLTGAAVTTPTSTSSLNLMNGSTWTMTGRSGVSSLSVANSVVAFAPPGAGGGFKTLTVGSYVGSGALMVMNVALGGSGSGADQIIVNGGTATGTTVLQIRNVGGLGGQTSGSGIPLVVAANGGTIAANAFQLARSPVVGGFRYTLDQTNGEWFLTSTPTTTQGQMQSSVNAVAKAQQAQAVTGRVLGSLLVGATQQISCSSCGSGFASIGSLALGMQGRWTLSPMLTALGGVSYNQWSAQGVSVYDAPTAAGSLIYDMSNWGSSRPFLQAGGGITPYESVHTARSYPNGSQMATGNSTAVDRSLSLFARAGWLARLSPTDEAAAYADIGRSWMQTGAYTEAEAALNPYPASAAAGLQTLNVARLGGQITHLFNGNIEANVSAAVAYGFGAGAGSFVNVADFGPIAPGAIPNTAWLEYGGRVGYRLNSNFVVDAFLLGTAFGEVGSTLHGGVALRFAF